MKLDGTGPRSMTRSERIVYTNAAIDALGTSLYTATFAVLAVSVRHLRVVDVGLILSLAGVAVLALSVPAGRLADRLGPVRFLVICKSLRGLLFLVFPFASSAPLIAMAVIGTAAIGAGNSSADQTLIGSLVGAARRLEGFGRIRAIRNASGVIGGGVAGAVLMLGGWKAYAAVLWINGLSYFFGAVAYCWLPTPRKDEATKVRGGKTVVFRDLRYIALTATSTAFILSSPLLQVGIPLWVGLHTAAPKAVIGVVSVINALIVVILQVRLSRPADTFKGARTYIWRSALWLAASTLLLLAAGRVGPWPAVLAILLAAIALTFGEILTAAAWWKVSYDLAPEERRSEYLAAFSLNVAALGMVGPVCMALVVTAGTVGWLALAAIFMVAGSVGLYLVPRAEPEAADEFGRSAVNSQQVQRSESS